MPHLRCMDHKMGMHASRPDGFSPRWVRPDSRYVGADQRASAQDTPPTQSATPPAAEPTPERWNLFYQATYIGQYHGAFHSPYEGPFSLQDHPERDVSLTTTLFFGLRLTDNTQLYFDPEIAGGRGFSGVDGLANSSNGELPRVATATPKPYLARQIGRASRRE